LRDGRFTKISPDGNEVEENWRNGFFQDFRMVERDMREQERANATSAAAAALRSNTERTRMQEEIDVEKAKVASMEMEMKRTRDGMIERERERCRERLEIQKEQDKRFQVMAEETQRIEAEWERKYRALTEQFARDSLEAEQKNKGLIETMAMKLADMANLRAERQTSGISLENYNKKVQENRSEFLTCIQNLSKVKTLNWSIGLVGRTSAGKSSLLNRMFGTTCKVGATRCTTGVKEVWRYEDPDIHKGISVWDVFGFNDEEAYESIETIKTFVSLHAVLLLYRDDIHSCKNTIELFRAADVKVIVVRSQIDTLTPEELQEIEQVEAPKAKEYGACHWTKTTTKSGTSADELKAYIISLPSARLAVPVVLGMTSGHPTGLDMPAPTQVAAVGLPALGDAGGQSMRPETEGEQGNSVELPDTVRRHRDSACNSCNTSPLQTKPEHSFVVEMDVGESGAAGAHLGGGGFLDLGSVEEWSLVQVGEFVSSLTADFGAKAGVYAEAMVREDVNGRVLLALDDAGMKDLGLSLGHRKLLAQRIARLAPATRAQEAARR
jgi:GTP-binding protein EngB required for normal cell division